MQYLQEFKRVPDSLTDLLPWAALVSTGVILNKDGSFQKTIRFRGPDLDSATPEELQVSSVHVNNVLRRFGSGWSLLFEANRHNADHYPQSTWDNPLAYIIDVERHKRFESNAHFESTYFITFTYLPPSESLNKLSAIFFSQSEEKVSYQRSLEYFISEVDRATALLERIFPEVSQLNDEQSLTYLHSTISDHPHPIKVPEIPMYLDAVIADTPLSAGADPKLGNLSLGVLGLLGFPGTSQPGLLDAINHLGFSYRWVTRFIPLDKFEAQKELEDYKRKWFGKRKSIVTLIKELCTKEESILSDSDALQKAQDSEAALLELGQDEISFGYLTTNLIIAGEEKESVSQQLSQVERVINGLGFVTKRETLNAVDAWLGTIPGNVRNNVRRPLVNTLNLSHLMPGASALWAGPKRNAHLEAPPLIVTETTGATPFRLVTHVADVGHTLILGPTGSGKSTLLGILEAQFMRYAGSQVYIFDKGGSARTLTTGMGGDYYELGTQDSELSLQPLGAIDEESEKAWAHEWVLDILTKENVVITPQVKGSIWDALSSLATTPADQRTLYGLTVHVQDEDLRKALFPYTYQGPHGKLLDGTKDNLRENRWQCFEMETLMETPGAVMPVLSYLFHRLEERFLGAPTMLVLDEAWLFLDHPAFAAKIREWLKTLRKKNVSVLFATQSLSDVDKSSIASTIREACFTKIYLPNSTALQEDATAFYKRFGLNARQIEILAHSLPKRDYYYTSPLGNRLFDLALDEIALAYCSGSSKERQSLLTELLAKSSSTDDFNLRFLEQLGLHEARKSYLNLQSMQEAA